MSCSALPDGTQHSRVTSKIQGQHCCLFSHWHVFYLTVKRKHMGIFKRELYLLLSASLSMQELSSSLMFLLHCCGKGTFCWLICKSSPLLSLQYTCRSLDFPIHPSWLSHCFMFQAKNKWTPDFRNSFFDPVLHTVALPGCPNRASPPVRLCLDSIPKCTGPGNLLSGPRASQIPPCNFTVKWKLIWLEEISKPKRVTKPKE